MEELFPKEEPEPAVESPKIVKPKMPAVEELPMEPAKGSEDSCEIVFRLPNGKRNSRIFLKTDKISGLYHYINHL